MISTDQTSSGHWTPYVRISEPIAAEYSAMATPEESGRPDHVGFAIPLVAASGSSAERNLVGAGIEASAVSTRSPRVCRFQDFH